MTFNLLEQPWIPVLDLNKELHEISLRQLLTQAQDYLSIEADTPLETVALYRLLLSILHRAFKGPDSPETAADWMREGFPREALDKYLTCYHKRFDLFDANAPFYQLPELPDEGYTQSWTKLSAAEGSGNTTPLFNPALRREAPKEPDSWITPAQAARKLLEHQTFVLGGLIKKFITSAPGGPSATNALLVIRGKTLHETLCLNLVPYTPDEDPNQRPVWEHPPYSMEWLKTDPTWPTPDIAQLYTWFARSIRLLPEECDGQVVIRKIAYASGIRPLYTGQMIDPMVTYSERDGGYSALSLKEGKAFWRDYHTLMPNIETRKTYPAAVLENALEIYKELDNGQTLAQTMVFGQYNDQAKILFWRMEQLPLPPALFSGAHNAGVLHSIVREALEKADEAFDQLHGAAKKLARHLLSQGGREPDSKKDILPLCRTFPHHAIYWSRLEPAFAKLVLSLTSETISDHAPGQILMRWNQDILDVGSAAWEQTSRSAGEDAVALRAVAKAQPIWLAYYAKLQAEIQLNKPDSIAQSEEVLA